MSIGCTSILVRCGRFRFRG